MEEEKLLAKTKMLPSRPAERRLARFGLSELLQRRRVVRRPPALIRPRSAFSAWMHRVVGGHRSRARMPFPHHLDHAVAGEMCAEEFRCFCYARRSIVSLCYPKRLEGSVSEEFASARHVCNTPRFWLPHFGSYAISS